MIHRDRQSPCPQLPGNYEICVRGHLGPQWQEWFGSLAITALPNGDTVIVGPMADQAALYGVLKKVRNLGLSLISVTPLPSTDATGEGDDRC